MRGRPAFLHVPQEPLEALQRALHNVVETNVPDHGLLPCALLLGLVNHELRARTNARTQLTEVLSG